MSGTLNPVLAYAAGGLTILSPCVLPLVPVVMATAGRSSRWGPLALAAGLIGSFTIVGFAVATLGAASGSDGEVVRAFGAALLALAGLVLLVPAMQQGLIRLATPLANWASERQQGLDRFGLAGQALVGVLLGAVWSPCVGPTLGAATVLAAQGENLGQVALVMAAFGFGIATVLLGIAFATRGLLARRRGGLIETGQRGKRILGAILLVVGILVLTGVDRIIEGVLVTASPDWLIDWSTRY
jgi:cytochrome c biogenesis protein CcdA